MHLLNTTKFRELKLFVDFHLLKSETFNHCDFPFNQENIYNMPKWPLSHRIIINYCDIC